MGTQSSRPLRSASDRTILESADRILGPRVLLVLQNGTRLAPALMNRVPDVSWDVFTLDHFLLTSLVDQLSEENSETDTAQVEVHCAPDLPDAEFDTIVLPTQAGGAAELTRDLLQQAADRIPDGGRVVISTDNTRDSWLQKQLKVLYGRVTVDKYRDGICYTARKRQQPAKHKEFGAEFAFRDGERLIFCETRPGVFSHRKIDGGARALVRSLNLLPDRFTPGRIAEIGSGCGAVATAAALRYPDARVLAIDSHVRAVQATETTAARNGVTNLQVMLSCHGVLPDAGKWDLFLANPPYYSDYRISELFLQSAVDSLRSGGRLHLVTRLTEWHENRMYELFDHVQHERIGEYDVFRGISR